MIEADLHLHSTASDGECSPRELVEQARLLGLKAIAITDHDSVDAVRETQKEGDKAGIMVIPGVEISCVYREQEVHILGYYIDTMDPGLENLLRVLGESRHSRLRRMVEKARASGFDVDVEDIDYKGVPGRAHMARALIRKGYVRDMREAFSLYLNVKRPLYVERYELTPREIIHTIQKAGGIASLAHPGLLKDIGIVDSIVGQGAGALEVYYPLHGKNQVRELKGLVEKYSLVSTGGSDFHGPGNGAQMGSAGISMEMLHDLRCRINI